MMECVTLYHCTLALALPSINIATWAGLAATVAIIGSCWRTIGLWAKRIADLVVCRIVLKDEAARAVMSQVWTIGRRSPFGLRLFGGTTSFVFPKRRVEVVSYETVSSEPLLFWLGRVPLVVSMGFDRGPQTEPGIGSWNDQNPPVTIRFLRGTIDVDGFVEQSVQAYNAIRQSREAASANTTGPKRFNVKRMHGPGGSQYNNGVSGNCAPSAAPISCSDSKVLIEQLQRNEVRLLHWKADDLVERSSDALPFSYHPIASDMLARFDRVGAWLKHEKWYRSHGLPWRLGVLLYGPPGGGKDTIVRNLAIRHDLPIYAFDLSSYDNSTFTSDWSLVMQNAPAIMLISDIDAVFSGRVNVVVQGKQRDGLTFDHFLNTVSGVGTSDGVLLAITTNRLDALDPAIGVPDKTTGRSTRPGRIDLAVEVGPMGETERHKLATLMVGDWPDEVGPLVDAGEGEMAAQFQDRCAQRALALIEERGLPATC